MAKTSTATDCLISSGFQKRGTNATSSLRRIRCPFDAKKKSSTTFAANPLLVDLDSDGDLDAIVYAAQAAIPWVVYSYDAFNSNYITIDQRPLTGSGQTISLDVDADGLTDLVILGERSRTISWQKNLGSRQFGAERTLFEAEQAISFIERGDLDGDGLDEVFFPVRNSITIADGTRVVNDLVGLFRGETEHWQPRVVVAGNATYARLRNVLWGDIQQDGRQELITAWDHDTIISFEVGQFTEQGTLVDNVLHYIEYNDPPNSAVTSLSLTDINGDGRMDLISNLGDFLQQPDGSLLRGDRRSTPTQMFDLNGDGHLEQIVTDRNIAIFRLDEFGDWTVATTLTPTSDNGIVVIDFDHDGDLDLVQGPIRNATSSNGSGTIHWFENLGSLSFEPHRFDVAGVERFSSIALSDLDGDGWIDVLATLLDRNEVYVFWNGT
ncbi:MAG: VCBS repeat-containing protein [Planctomycetales bacterium]|nr:VCBS repeat-containing protein [Planctomycetales bacterium]